MRRITSKALADEARFLRVFVYGAPGSGKTWFGASACLSENTSPWLFLSYRSQIQSLHSHAKYCKAMDEGDLVIVELERYEDLNAIYQWLLVRKRGHNTKFDELFPDEWPKGITLDSITELQRSEIMRRAGTAAGRVVTEPAWPKIRHWGVLLHQFTLLGRLMFDSPEEFPYHVVFCALEMAQYKRDSVALSTEDNRPSGYKVALQGQAQDLVPAYALTLMRLVRAPRNAQVYARGLTSAVNAHTKDQSGRFAPKLNGPMIPQMVATLEGGADKK